MANLTDRAARNLTPYDSAVADGTVTGLYLYPSSKKGHGKWKLRYVSPETGKRRDMGLGGYPAVGIAQAREAGIAARKAIANGIDPLAESARVEASQAAQGATKKYTFEVAAREVYETLKPSWESPKHATQWITTLQTYVFPMIGTVHVEALQPKDFSRVLLPIWLDKVETAGRVKQRCHTVMKWCWGRDLVTRNVVDMVDTLLPKRPSKAVTVEHQPAVPWREVPSFVTGVLRKSSDVTRDIIEFVLLTAARSGEVRHMVWEEVDLDRGIWTLSAKRMKMRQPHRVPLSAAAVVVLEKRKTLAKHAALVFPSPRGKVLTDMAMTSLMRKNNVASDTPERTATIHGFRSSFRDWASEQGYPSNLAERALAHTIRNQSEAAYHRTDLLEERRPMMEAWGEHVCGATRK
jgi:integrase